MNNICQQNFFFKNWEKNSLKRNSLVSKIQPLQYTSTNQFRAKYTQTKSEVHKKQIYVK